MDNTSISLYHQLVAFRGLLLRLVGLSIQCEKPHSAAVKTVFCELAHNVALQTEIAASSLSAGVTLHAAL